jgi:hypothetical protein
MDWRRVAGLTVLTVAIAIPAAFLGLPFAVRGFVRAITLLVDAYLWAAISISTGASVWSLVATVGRTIVGALGSPMASAILIVLVAVTMLAVFLLQRLFDSEEESSR